MNQPGSRPPPAHGSLLFTPHGYCFLSNACVLGPEQIWLQHTIRAGPSRADGLPALFLVMI